jgi:hypothetical protein
MKDGITVDSLDKEGRLQRSEIWFHENFVAIHLHGFTDEEEFAKLTTRYRKIWGCWYYTMETVLPRFVINKIINEEACLNKVIEWCFKDIKEDNNE